MTAGTYEASAQGRNGPVNVKVDVTKDRITSVQVTGHKETPGIGTLAVKDLPRAIVEAQTTGSTPFRAPPLPRTPCARP